MAGAPLPQQQPQPQPATRHHVEPNYPPPAPAIRKTITPVAPHGITPPPADRTLICGFLPVPTSIGQLLLWLLAIWLSTAFVFLIVGQISTLWSIVARVMFFACTVEIIRQAWHVLRARQQVLGSKDVSLLWGLVKLVAWDPVEGVLFLRDKSLGFADDDLHDGQGGIRFLYPILGEELALRVPLEMQTLRLRDDQVLTREYLSVTVKGSMKWRIVDIKKFYLLVSRELRSTTDQADDIQQWRSRRGASTEHGDADRTTNELLTAAIEWLRLFAEEQTRLVISRVSSGLLIADRLSQELPEVKGALQEAVAGIPAPATGAGPDWTGAADGLARTIYETICARVRDYGIQVEDVTLQEIRLPDDVVSECIKACKTAYLPIRAQREASEKRAQLGVEVDLLGREAVATRTIVGAAPAYSLMDFVQNFLNKRMADPTGVGLSAATAGALAGMTTAALPAAIPPPQAQP